MSLRTESAFVVECDGEGCQEEYVALVGMDAKDAVYESGFASENGKHYCDQCCETKPEEDDEP
jgi:hypothetical protein